MTKIYGSPQFRVSLTRLFSLRSSTTSPTRGEVKYNAFSVKLKLFIKTNLCELIRWLFYLSPCPATPNGYAVASGRAIVLKVRLKDGSLQRYRLASAILFLPCSPHFWRFINIALEITINLRIQATIAT